MYPRRGFAGDKDVFNHRRQSYHRLIENDYHHH